MRSALTIIGIILIIAGIFTFAYRGVTYTDREQIAQLGDLKVTAEKEKTIYFPPILGGVSIVAGIILVVVGRRKS